SMLDVSPFTTSLRSCCSICLTCCSAPASFLVAEDFLVVCENPRATIKTGTNATATARFIIVLRGDGKCAGFGKMSLLAQRASAQLRLADYQQLDTSLH